MHTQKVMKLTKILHGKLVLKGIDDMAK